jgi:hypothetical protein
MDIRTNTLNHQLLHHHTMDHLPIMMDLRLPHHIMDHLHHIMDLRLPHRIMDHLHHIMDLLRLIMARPAVDRHGRGQERSQEKNQERSQARSLISVPAGAGIITTSTVNRT